MLQEDSQEWTDINSVTQRVEFDTREQMFKSNRNFVETAMVAKATMNKGNTDNLNILIIADYIYW